MPDEKQHPPKVETEEATEELTPKEDLPQSVPGFHLRQKLGEGGMGEVFEAEQLEPVRRRVALKLIKRGMESKEVLARFDSERQALALMSHPNVAQVYDAGTTTDGRPYFVMEFVQGVSVTQYCDTNRLTTAERLELFTQICDGVQHAHHKGVIHRDIKPSNVLVKIRDSKPVPKIIDFGVAKAISQRLTEQTLFTAIGQFIGTPEYMSPEQAEMTELDIDTRTDVYSLGVVLYEMLVGAQPFDSRELRRSGYDEMRRKIREEEPPRPSVRLSGLGEKSTAAAKNRRLEPSTLARRLHGDLDWITMKALEKDRTRRYDSPGELAADIGRHLRDEPVLAGPPSTTYRVKKFVRRHTVGVAASALVVLALILGIAGTTVGMIRSRTAERAASREARNATAVTDFLVRLFEVADPTEARNKEISAHELLDRGTGQMAEELEHQPEVRAMLSGVLGRVYVNLGLFDQAAPLLEKALKLEVELHGEETAAAADAADKIAVLDMLTGDFEKAEPRLHEVLALRRRLHGDRSSEVAESLYHVASFHLHRGEFRAAIPLLKEALATERELSGGPNETTAAIINDLAYSAGKLGQDDEAERLNREALAQRREILGDDHPSVAQSLNNLGRDLSRRGNYDEAEQMIREAVALNRKIYGERHPELNATLSSLATVLRDSGQLAEAEQLLHQVTEADRATFGNDHPYVASDLIKLSSVVGHLGDLSAAEDYLREALEIQRKTFAEDSWQIASTKSLLGGCVAKQGDNRQAEQLLVPSYEIIASAFGEDHARSVAACRRVIANYEAWGKPELADSYRRTEGEGG